MAHPTHSLDSLTSPVTITRSLVEGGASCSTGYGVFGMLSMGREFSFQERWRSLCIAITTILWVYWLLFLTSRTAFMFAFLRCAVAPFDHSWNLWAQWDFKKRKQKNLHNNTPQPDRTANLVSVCQFFELKASETEPIPPIANVSLVICAVLIHSSFK